MTDSLTSRVTRLELQNRALRASLLFGALGLVTCGGGGVTSNYERVNTRVLVIQSADDKPQIVVEDGTITFVRSGGNVTLDADAVAKLLAGS